jgi:hypothetical protein
MVARVTALVLLIATAADAAVLCAKPRKDGTFSTSVKIREGCKTAEVQLDPAALGLQGPPGPQGPQGIQGESGVCECTTTTTTSTTTTSTIASEEPHCCDGGGIACYMATSCGEGIPGPGVCRGDTTCGAPDDPGPCCNVTSVATALGAVCLISPDFSYLCGNNPITQGICTATGCQ